jgi:HKD family nuclease
MQVKFLSQPFPGAEQIGTAISAALGNDAATAALFVTAWGKQSGLSRLAKSLTSLRDRGGTCRAVLGVDEGGATIEGLKLALALFDEAWIFHDPGARTFHPKMYVVEGEKSASALIGSGNMTRGGLFTNYEAAVLATLDLANHEDQEFLATARAFFERLVGSGACKPLTPELIEELRADPGVLLLSERRANRARSKRRARATEAESAFGTSALPGLLGAPPPDIPPLSDEEDDDDDTLAGEAPAVGVAGGEGIGGAGDGFFKALSHNDVSEKDSPGQIIIPIKFLSFFGTLEVQKDESEDDGPRQSHREFSLRFIDGEEELEIETGRVILYEPAKAHKRPNPEVRFTLRNRKLQRRLSKDDVLAFGRDAQGIVVERHPAGWRPPGVEQKTRYGSA